MRDHLATAQLYYAPAYVLTVLGRNITANIWARLMSLTLTESRGDRADQLNIELDDTDSEMARPWPR